jgi:hypothetical protein
MSRLYDCLPERGKQKVMGACLDCGGEYHKALFDFLTTGQGAIQICLKHHMSRSTLERITKQYYKQLSDKLF